VAAPTHLLVIPTAFKWHKVYTDIDGPEACTQEIEEVAGLGFGGHAGDIAKRSSMCC
jgi:hypothetical protein